MITDEAMCSLALDIEQHGLETGQMGQLHLLTQTPDNMALSHSSSNHILITLLRISWLYHPHF